MLTVLVSAERDDASALQATLATLIPGALDGLVREVVVVASSGDEVRELAEHAGCRIVAPEDLRTAIVAARGDWLLLLAAGWELEPGWIEAVWTHAAVGVPARFTRAGGVIAGLLAFRRPTLQTGVLAPRVRLVDRYRPGMSLAALAAGVRTRRLTARIKPPRG